jgi:broad specificity phosphatase PhoE
MQPLTYFLRHGQTDWNVEDRFQGQADTPVNAVGRAQADRNGHQLRTLITEPAAFDFVASPMKRTRETMERIRAAMGLEPQAYRTDARLVELHFGEWQGLAYAEVKARYPDGRKQRLLDKWHYRPPGRDAESYAMLAARIGPWLAELSRPTVCVTHGGVIRCLFALVGRVPKPEAAAMNVPQDKVLKMEGGQLAWI